MFIRCCQINLRLATNTKARFVNVLLDKVDIDHKLVHNTNYILTIPGAKLLTRHHLLHSDLRRILKVFELKVKSY